MGLNYAYEIWIERDRLPALFESLRRRTQAVGITPLVTADGVEIPLVSHIDPARVEAVPFDGSFTHDGPDAAIDFAAIDPAIDDVYGSAGLLCGLCADGLDWLGDAPMATWVSFMATTSSLSRALVASAPVRAFFVGLAKDCGALACDFDTETDSPSILFARLPRVFDESSRNGMVPRACFFPPGTQDEDRLRRKLWCTALPETVDYADLDRLLAAAQDAESGVRVSACRALGGVDPSPAVEPLVGLLADADWRVRAVAAGTLGSACTFGDPRWSPAPLAPQLVAATSDPHSEVRIAAIRALGSHARRADVRATFLQLIGSLGTRQPDLGPWVAILQAVTSRRQDPPHAAEFIVAIEARLPQLPLRRTAMATLDTLERNRLDTQS